MDLIDLLARADAFFAAPDQFPRLRLEFGNK
jgi:hypothetical protein